MIFAPSGTTIGERRIISGFLLLPLTIGGERRWLCRASYEVEFCREVYPSYEHWLPDSYDCDYFWRPLRWVSPSTSP